MATTRGSYAQSQIPLAKDAAAYPQWSEVVTKLGGAGAEGANAGGTAIGTGADLEITLPFDPAYVEVFNETQLAVFKKFPSMPTAKCLKEVTAGTKSYLATVGITLGVKKVTLGSGVHAASDVLHVVAYGFPGVNIT